jgi:hypothetical protein
MNYNKTSISLTNPFTAKDCIASDGGVTGNKTDNWKVVGSPTIVTNDEGTNISGLGGYKSSVK